MSRPCSEGVGGEQETEIVRYERQRDGAEWDDGQAQQQRSEAHGGSGYPSAACEICESSLNATEARVTKPWQSKRNSESDDGEAGFNHHQRNVIFGNGGQEHGWSL